MIRLCVLLCVFALCAGCMYDNPYALQAWCDGG